MGTFRSRQIQQFNVSTLRLGRNGLTLPQGQTGQRAQENNEGQIRYNSNLSMLEVYLNNRWHYLRTLRSITEPAVVTDTYLVSIPNDFVILGGDVTLVLPEMASFTEAYPNTPAVFYLHLQQDNEGNHTATLVSGSENNIEIELPNFETAADSHMLYELTYSSVGAAEWSAAKLSSL